MKHSIAVKFLAFFLAALSLVAAFSGVMGIVAIEGAGLYVSSLGQLQGREYKNISASIAESFVKLYTAEQLGAVPYTLKQSLFSDPLKRSDADYWYLTLQQDGAVILETGNPKALAHHAVSQTHTIRQSEYPVVSKLSPQDLEEQAAEDSSAPRQSLATAVPKGWLYWETETVFSNSKLTTYYLYYYQAPEYTVTVYMQEQVLENSSLHILTAIYPYRYACIAILVLGILLFAATMLHLFLIAGVHPDGRKQPAGLCLLPADLYLLLTAVAEALLLLLFSAMNRWVQSEGPHPGNLSLVATVLLVIALLGIGPLYVIAAQLKLSSAYLWQHSLLCRGIRKLRRLLAALAALLPILWQWLVCSGLMGLSLAILFPLASGGNIYWRILLILDLLACCGIILYGGWCFAALTAGVRRMSQGNLGHKVSTRFLSGGFLTMANALNSLSETAKTAAEHEMRAERMRSELITNVSHDIKTPLTGIISFVDLLQKPHTAAQQAEYLGVLSRQSSRLKKLIDDLMELSKATTGNITANPAPMDAVETVNQALGEFSDRLAQAQLTPVFQPGDASVSMLADGRLAWRVLSNLLSNAVKYSLPGTRLYVELHALEDQVLLSLKNISAQPLTVDAQELMERFVQGDASRGSDGSGLGLNIAKSLMELQGGGMQLLLDGDLFKVTLTFPRA